MPRKQCKIADDESSGDGSSSTDVDDISGVKLSYFHIIGLNETKIYLLLLFMYNIHLIVFFWKGLPKNESSNQRFCMISKFKKANARYHMTKFTRNLKETELQTAYKFNFDHPKYLIFYNEQEKNAYGNPKAYRILTKGVAKQLFAEGQGNEPSATWTRYQMAVTKHKDTERKSSSMFAYLDASDPVVQFQKYLDDDENIVDEVPFFALSF